MRKQLRLRVDGASSLTNYSINHRNSSAVWPCRVCMYQMHLSETLLFQYSANSSLSQTKHDNSVVTLAYYFGGRFRYVQNALNPSTQQRTVANHKEPTNTLTSPLCTFLQQGLAQLLELLMQGLVACGTAQGRQTIRTSNPVTWDGSPKRMTPPIAGFLLLQISRVT